MTKLLIFKLKPTLGNLYIFADKIIAFRVWGEGVRIVTINESFIVENTIQEVLEIIRKVE